MENEEQFQNNAGSGRVTLMLTLVLLGIVVITAFLLRHLHHH